MGKPLFARLSSPTPAPQLLFDARNVAGYEVVIFNEDTLEYTTLEGAPLPGPAPVLGALRPPRRRSAARMCSCRWTGTGFSRGALITFNGNEEATTVVTLETTIAMATATTPGEYAVTVKNQDGQESAPLMFTFTEPTAQRKRSTREE